MKGEVDRIVIQVLEDYLRYTSSDLNNPEQVNDVFMMVMDDKVSVFSLFTLMANSDSESDNHVTLLDIKDNLKDYSINKLRCVASVLIDFLNDLTKEK